MLDCDLPVACSAAFRIDVSPRSQLSLLKGLISSRQTRPKCEVIMCARIHSPRHRIKFLWTLVVLGTTAAGITVGTLRAQSSSASDVYRVEEDWLLVVGDPDVLANGPQVTSTISPVNMDTAYCAFDVNYRTQPDYTAGGLQIHSWDPEDLIAFSNSTHTAMLATSGETVTWTQSMTLRNGKILFQIKNGSSQTWGDFGIDPNGDSSDPLQLSVRTSLANLNSYSSDVSLQNSGISYASNLVNSLALVAVRWYDSDGKLIRQTTNQRFVYPQQ